MRYFSLSLVLLSLAAPFAGAGEATTKPVICHIDFLSQHAACTILVNGFPVQRDSGSGGYSFSGFLNQYVKQGDNEITIAWTPVTGADNLAGDPDISGSIYLVAPGRADTKPAPVANIEIKARTADHPKGSSATTKFNVPNFPTADLPWLQPGPKELTDADTKEVKALALKLVQTFEAKQVDALAKLYAARDAREATSLGLTVEHLSSMRCRATQAMFNAPSYEITARKAENLAIVKQGDVNLYEVQTTDGKPLIEGTGEDGMAISTTIFLARVNGRWQIVK